MFRPVPPVLDHRVACPRIALVTCTQRPAPGDLVTCSTGTPSPMQCPKIRRFEWEMTPNDGQFSTLAKGEFLTLS